MFPNLLISETTIAISVYAFAVELPALCAFQWAGKRHCFCRSRTKQWKTGWMARPGYAYVLCLPASYGVSAVQTAGSFAGAKTTAASAAPLQWRTKLSTTLRAFCLLHTFCQRPLLALQQFAWQSTSLLVACLCLVSYMCPCVSMYPHCIALPRDPLSAILL